MDVSEISQDVNSNGLEMSAPDLQVKFHLTANCWEEGYVYCLINTLAITLNNFLKHVKFHRSNCSPLSSASTKPLQPAGWWTAAGQVLTWLMTVSQCGELLMQELFVCRNFSFQQIIHSLYNADIQLRAVCIKSNKPKCRDKGLRWKLRHQRTSSSEEYCTLKIPHKQRERDAQIQLIR